jgi:hypothetical protein
LGEGREIGEKGSEAVDREAVAGSAFSPGFNAF